MEISRAITEKRLLTFSYDGFQRTVEPHTYGVDKTAMKPFVHIKSAAAAVRANTAGGKCSMSLRSAACL